MVARRGRRAELAATPTHPFELVEQADRGARAVDRWRFAILLPSPPTSPPPIHRSCAEARSTSDPSTARLLRLASRSVPRSASPTFQRPPPHRACQSTAAAADSVGCSATPLSHSSARPSLAELSVGAPSLGRSPFFTSADADTAAWSWQRQACAPRHLALRRRRCPARARPPDAAWCLCLPTGCERVGEVKERRRRHEGRRGCGIRGGAAVAAAAGVAVQPRPGAREVLALRRYGTQICSCYLSFADGSIRILWIGSATRDLNCVW